MRMELPRMNLRRLERSVGAVALVFGLTGTGWSVYTQNQDSSQVSCQTRINQKFEEIITARSSLTNENTQNVNDFIVALLNSKSSTPEQNQKVIAHYLTELAKVNNELKRTTFPTIGTC